MPDQRPAPSHYDARVEEIQLVLTMAEVLHEDLDPTEPGTQRLSMLIGECQTRITDLRHEQHQEATTGQRTSPNRCTDPERTTLSGGAR